MSQSRAEHSDFIGGIDDRGLEHVNGPCGNSFMDQNAGAVNLFAFISESHGLQRFSRLGWVREPYLRGVALAIELGGLSCPHWHSSAEHGNSSRFCQRVFHHEPSTDARKRGQSQGHEARRAGSNNDRAALPGRDESGRVL